MALSIQQHLELPILQFVHAGLMTTDEVLTGCDILLQLCETVTYDVVIDLTEAMYVWDNDSPDAMKQMMTAIGHPNVRHISYVIPGAEHHDLAELLREGYAQANLTHKMSFANTRDVAIAAIKARYAGIAD